MFSEHQALSAPCFKCSWISRPLCARLLGPLFEANVRNLRRGLLTMLATVHAWHTFSGHSKGLGFRVDGLLHLSN